MPGVRSDVWHRGVGTGLFVSNGARCFFRIFALRGASLKVSPWLRLGITRRVCYFSMKIITLQKVGCGS